MAAKPGDEIIITKWAGVMGTAIIAAEKEEELCKVFPASFINSAKSMNMYRDVSRDRSIAESFDASSVRAAGYGGIYGALWDMSSENGVGLEVNLRDIPIKQETIEIADYYDTDPYYLFSEGALLVTVKQGYRLSRSLKDEGINAEVIGAVTDSNDRVVINNGIRRFLSPRYKDPLDGIMGGEKYYE